MVAPSDTLLIMPTAIMQSYKETGTCLRLFKSRLRRQQRACLVVQSSGGVSSAAPAVTVPKGPKDQVDQAAAACERAFKAGHSRQRVELLLPLIGATDIDDWPGGIRQQFKAASPLLEQLLQSLRQLEGLQGGLKGEILDEGDAVGAWVGTALAAVLFPTAESLKQVRSIAEKVGPQGLTLIVNPQWSTKGQVIHDFGFLPWQRKASEEVVASFTEAYCLKQLRINGDEVRLLKAFPGNWQVFVARGLGGAFECVLQQKDYPAYQQLDSLLRSLDWSQSSKPLLRRVSDEMEFLQRSIETPPQNQQQEDK
ncbi:hypothetical protein N2152v2_010905 [Parachlorella kessleri]